MKDLLATWDKQFPGRVDNMLRALANVIPSHLLDRKLAGFGSARLQPGEEPMAEWLSAQPEGRLQQPIALQWADLAEDVLLRS
jgi:tRNA 2-thiocytidine biosynthesis protein TtcA